MTLFDKIHINNISCFKYYKKYSTDTCYNMDERWTYHAKWEKKMVVKDHISYDLIYIKYLE